MQIKLISYSENKLVLMNEAHGIIADSIKEATNEDVKFSYCTTQKDLFVGIQNAIQSSNIIIIAVDVSKFISTKAALFRALGFKCKLNGEIIDLLSSDKCMATLNEKQTNAHAAIPLGAEAFITYDGLFSGVGIKAGPQKLILVPIDEKRIQTIIDNGMLSFAFGDIKKEEVVPEEEIAEETAEEVAETETEEINPDYVEIYSAPQTPEKVAEEAPQPDYENIESSSLVANDNEETSDNYVQKTYIQSKVEGITSRGFKISVVRQPENKLCGDILGELESIPGVQFVDLPIDSTLADDAKRKENIASNARMAMAQSGSTFAIGASEIYYAENNEAYIFVTLTDSQKSSVYKVFAAPEDGAKELYRDGIVSVVEKIEEMVKTTDFTAATTEPYYAQPEPQHNEKKKMPSSTLIIMWVLIIIAVAAFTVLVLDIALSESASAMTSANEIISQVNNILLR